MFEKTRKYIHIVILTILFVFILMNIFFYEKKTNCDFSISLYNINNNINIELWKNDIDDRYYLFVPGIIEPYNLKVAINGSNFIYVDDVKLNNNDIVNDLFMEGDHIIKDSDSNEYFVSVLYGSEIPCIFIETKDEGFEIIKNNKEEKTKGLFSYVDGNSNIISSLRHIKTRGNGSWTYSKKII